MVMLLMVCLVVSVHCVCVTEVIFNQPLENETWSLFDFADLSPKNRRNTGLSIIQLMLVRLLQV